MEREIDVIEETLEREIDVKEDVIRELPALEDLTIKPSKETQIFEHKGVYGYDKVTVEAVSDDYVIPSDKLTITENGTYDVKQYAEVETDIHEANKYAPIFISFYRCNQTNIDEDLSNLDLSNLTDGSYMFDSSNKLTSINWTNQNAPNLTTVSNFVANNRSGLKTVDLSNWNVPNVENMYSMFYYDELLTSVILKGWYCPKLKRVANMFSMCKKLMFVDIRDLTFDSISTTASDYQYMFSSSYHKNTEIIVKGETEKTWLLEKFNFLTKVKTVAEYQAEGGV